MKAQPSPYLVLAMTLLAAGTLLLLLAAYTPALTATPKPANVSLTPTLVPVPTTVPLPFLEAGPARPHATPMPRGR